MFEELLSLDTSEDLSVDGSDEDEIGIIYEKPIISRKITSGWEIKNIVERIKEDLPSRPACSGYKFINSQGPVSLDQIDPKKLKITNITAFKRKVGPDRTAGGPCQDRQKRARSRIPATKSRLPQPVMKVRPERPGRNRSPAPSLPVAVTEPISRTYVTESESSKEQWSGRAERRDPGVQGSRSSRLDLDSLLSLTESESEDDNDNSDTSELLAERSAARGLESQKEKDGQCVEREDSPSKPDLKPNFLLELLELESSEDDSDQTDTSDTLAERRERSPISQSGEQEDGQREKFSAPVISQWEDREVQSEVQDSSPSKPGQRIEGIEGIERSPTSRGQQETPAAPREDERSQKVQIPDCSVAERKEKETSSQEYYKVNTSSKAEKDQENEASNTYIPVSDAQIEFLSNFGLVTIQAAHEIRLKVSSEVSTNERLTRSKMKGMLKKDMKPNTGTVRKKSRK